MIPSTHTLLPLESRPPASFLVSHISLFRHRFPHAPPHVPLSLLISWRTAEARASQAVVRDTRSRKQARILRHPSQPSFRRHPEGHSETRKDTLEGGRHSSSLLDIISVPHDDESSPSARSSYDTSSLDPIIELSSSPPLSPAAPSSPELISVSLTTEPVKTLHNLCPRHSIDECAHVAENNLLPAHETDLVVGKPEFHDFQSHALSLTNMHNHVTTFSEFHPTRASDLHSPRMQSFPAPSMMDHPDAGSVSTGVEITTMEKVPPSRPRYNSETAVDAVHRPQAGTSLDGDSSEGRGRGQNQTRRLPPSIVVTSALQSRPQERRRERGIRRTLSASSSCKSSAGRSKSESPPSNPPVSVPPLLSAHMLRMRSGSRLSSTPLLRGFRSARPATMPQLSAPKATTASAPR
ncbi:hypothetical protein F5148DRAFT_1181560 [Russula earlei]|uniref:Uncharacterized protein n=1 Tax=Russula earlei TaxID=71964 RepID=A0ACC0UEP5_9AGAM|nr:hypothetical protein F5148DRAFT_1181560 [Russula earlei]